MLQDPGFSQVIALTTSTGSCSSMAQKVQVLLVDDLDGSEAVETVRFSLDGVPYEIDLSGDNAGQLRQELARYIKRARKAGSQGKVRKRANRAALELWLDRVRVWASRNNYTLQQRGRIPDEVTRAYIKANPEDPRPAS